MPTLLLRFPGGRYHATPWGHHVNEGLVEWPPSPWRLLRALIASGYATQGWTELPPEARSLLEAMAGTLPRYRLPAASLAHSRHYMPLGIIDKGREKTTLVFDAWANVGDGVLAVRWDCAVDERARAIFGTLARNLGYIGRSESWVEGCAIGDEAALPVGDHAEPHVLGQALRPECDQISLMAAAPPEDYTSWREAAVRDALAPYPLPAGKMKASQRVLKDRAHAEAPYPRDLLDCLQRDTAWWKAHGWSQPPGSHRVLYWRRLAALNVSPPSQPAHVVPDRVPMMLLALTTPSGSLSALPLRARSLPQGELLHRALVSHVGRGGLVDCPELIGRDATGGPLRGHRHAHILSLDLDGDRRLDHVLVYAPMGLGFEAQRAIRGLRRTFTKGGVGELRVAVAGAGCLDDLRRLSMPLRTGVERILGPSGGAAVWSSVTPFVAPRHHKRRGKNSLEGQVNAELASRGLPSAVVEVLSWDEDTLDLRHSVRVRKHGGPPPPSDFGFSLRLTFERPVSGPIVLGYGSHFGLGLFSAVEP